MAQSKHSTSIKHQQPPTNHTTQQQKQQQHSLPSLKQNFPLSSYSTVELTIRRFEESDSERCRELFVAGMRELYPAAFKQTLKGKLAISAACLTSLALVAFNASIYFYILIVVVPCIVIASSVSYQFGNYIDSSLNSDLACIHEFYIEQEKSDFWVAQLNHDTSIQTGSFVSVVPAGTVVGMVACEYKADMNQCELRRMSVDGRVRRLRIASTLCQALKDWAKYIESDAVYLTTSGVQTVAIRMYEKNGFTISHTTNHPIGSYSLIHMTLQV